MPLESTLLAQLDGSEKSSIITDEELEEIGAAYGSRAKYEEAMRSIAERISGAPLGRRDVSVPVGHGKIFPRVFAGTSTVPLGSLPEIKRINIVGKAINSAADAAQLFSLFRDPRIEIFNIAYASKNGAVLAHAAWTSGLPGLAVSTYGLTPFDGLDLIQKTKERLNADTIWIAHNHPSGNPKPSGNDIEVTKFYAAHFGDAFAGHIVLDHDTFSMIFHDGASIQGRLKEPARNYASGRRMRSATIDGPQLVAGMFKKVLAVGEDTAAIAVLDGRHRVVSWLYANSGDASEIKKYMRVSGGAKAIAITNSNALFENYCSLSDRALDTKDDIFLDVIRVNRLTGDFEQSHAFHGGDWQMSESKGAKFVLDSLDAGIAREQPVPHKNKKQDGASMEHYRIRYCRPDGNGGFAEVTPDIASVFRVFLRSNGKEIHLKDFFPLSEANAFIAAQREKQAQGDLKKMDGKDALFMPGSDAARRYKEQLAALLESRASSAETIDLGRLPYIYAALGIADERLKTNGKAILKALGIEGRNKHSVPMETIESLLSLAHDPEAVCKSLSASNNPNAYIAILNAKTAAREQIIAILSPSRDGNGFTFIPTVYEKHNFGRFLNRIHEEQKILYIKSKGSELWGQLQSLPRHNQEPSIKNILTKNDIVNDFFRISVQAQSPSHERGNFNSKENFMSDQFEWDDDGILEQRFQFPAFFKVEQANSSDVEISVFDDPEALEFDSPQLTFTIQGNIETAKKLVEDTIAHFDEKKNVWMDDIEKHLGSQVIQLQQKTEKSMNDAHSPPLSGRDNNSKEKNMSDERQRVSDQVDAYLSELKGTAPILEGQKELSPREQAFREAVVNATHQRKVVADAIKAGTLCCLPGADGYADTVPAVNIMTPHKPYHGENLLFLKAIQKQEQNGFPTAEYVTYHQIDKAREEGLDLYVRQGQKGVSLIIDEQKETGEWENKNIRLFNVAQLNNPELIKEWAEKKIEEQAQKDLERQRARYGTGYTPQEKQKEKGPAVIACSSTEPEKYLGQYLAAVSFGSKFKATPEQAAEFSEKMINALYKQMEPRKNEKTGEIKQPPLNKETGQPITDPFSLEKISRDANAECKIFMTQTRMEAAKLNHPEQTLEQQQSRGGRGM